MQNLMQNIDIPYTVSELASEVAIEMNDAMSDKASSIVNSAMNESEMAHRALWYVRNFRRDTKLSVEDYNRIRSLVFVEKKLLMNPNSKRFENRWQTLNAELGFPEWPEWSLRQTIIDMRYMNKTLDRIKDDYCGLPGVDHVFFDTFDNTFRLGGRYASANPVVELSFDYDDLENIIVPKHLQD